MIISEKQLTQLVQIVHVYLSALDTLSSIYGDLLTSCGLHNKKYIADLLMKIANQQSEELREIE